MKLICCDTYYPDFLKTLRIDAASSYECELQKVLALSFGTGDSYTRHLGKLGWQVTDVVANCIPLQKMWALERGWNESNPQLIAWQQIMKGGSDVVFLQDLNLFNPVALGILKAEYILTGQLSCPWPGDEIVRQFGVLFTSFPHYIPRIEALGVRAVYNPLAFDPIVLERTGKPGECEYDCVFIGGVGAPSHWRYGMEVLETVAREIPTFQWWGYGIDLLPADSALRENYQGEAWGLAMYEILLQSKICLNRHGEVAEGYANNMRLYESTGAGTLLLTEKAENLSELFEYYEVVSYHSPADAVRHIKHFLRYPEEREQIAAAGQKRTLRDHTYAERMKTVSDTLKEMLVTA